MYLYGASGHAKVIKESLESQNITVQGFFDDNVSLETFCNKKVMHSYSLQSPVIVSIGNNAIRKKISEQLKCKFGIAIHKNAVVSPSSRIAPGSVVMAGAVINAEAKIGAHCIINTSVSIDHECRVGDYVHLSPHSTLCGNVHVGEGTWIGAGSTVIQGINIGKWSVIGAGSVVISDIPDGVLAYGNPCRVIRKL